MTPPPTGFRTFGGDDDRGDRGEGVAAGSRGHAAAAGASSSRPAGLSARSALVVAAFACLLLLPALGGSVRVLTQHEVFAAQTAREMLATGDWVVPHFAGVPRRNKPPGMYWLIAGAMALFQSRAEWVARLPAALAGVATALVVARLAARWLGDAAGLVAGLMQASFAYVLLQARLAEADMPMAAAVTAAMAAFAAGAIDETRGPGGDGDLAGRRPTAGTGRFRQRLLALAFGLATGASVVLKGPGALFVLAGCLVWVALTGRWRALRFVVHPLAVGAFVAVAGAWPAAAIARDPGFATVWWRETFGRAGGEFGESEPWFVYLYWVPLFLMPWLPFAVAGAVGWWRRVGGWDGMGATAPTRASVWGGPRPAAVAARFRRLRALSAAHPRAAFLACWFAAGLVLLFFFKARHKHYAIPMLPPVTVVAAAGFVAWLRDARRADPRGGRRAGVIALVAGAVAVGAVLAAVPKAKAGSAVTAAVVAVGVAAVALLYARRRPVPAAAACFVTMLAAGLGYQWLILPAHDDYRASTALARRADAVVPPGQPIHLVALGEAHAAYYLDHPLVRVDRRATVAARVRAALADPAPGGAGPAAAFVLCPASVLPLLAEAGAVTELDRVDHLRRTEKDPVVLARVDGGPAAATPTATPPVTASTGLTPVRSPPRSR